MTLRLRPPVTPYIYGPGIQAPPSATRRIAVQNYSNGLPYQWLVEFNRNYEQAVERTPKRKRHGRERFVQDFTEVRVSGSPYVKIRMWNTAVPMSRQELDDYFLHFGEGEDERWDVTSADASFGQGATSSTMPWNPAGVVCISVDPKRPDKCIGMIRADTGTEYAPVMLEHPTDVDWDGNPETDKIVPIVAGALYAGMDLYQAIPADVHRDGGMVYVLLGQSCNSHNINGDPNRGEKMRSAIDVLEARIYVPQNVSLAYLANAPKTVTLKGGQRFTVNGTPMVVDNRTLKGYRAWAARKGVKFLGDIPLDAHGTVAKVWLNADLWNYQQISKRAFNGPRKPGETVIERDGKYYKKTSVDSWYVNDGEGFVGYVYKNEVMDLFPKRDKASKLSDYGVLYVSDRVGILIVPPRLRDITGTAWGVMQNNARSTLVDKSGTALDPKEWQEKFSEAIETNPKLDALRKAIDAARNRLLSPQSADRSSVTRRLLSRIKGRILQNTMIIHPKGTLPADPTGENVPGLGQRGGDGPPNPNPGPGNANPVEQAQPPADPNNPQSNNGLIRRANSLPEVIWLPNDVGTPWVSICTEPEAQGQFAFIRKEPDAIRIYLNSDHYIYQEESLYYMGQWLREHPSLRPFQHIVIQALRDKYEDIAVQVFMHLHGELKNVNTTIEYLSGKMFNGPLTRAGVSIPMPNPLSTALHGYPVELAVSMSMSSLTQAQRKMVATP